MVTPHQIDEIQDFLTDFVFINRGRIVLECNMDVFQSRYLEVMVTQEHLATARSMHPIYERQVFGRSILLFDNAERQHLTRLGDVRTPTIADVFVAVMEQEPGARGAA